MDSGPAMAAGGLILVGLLTLQGPGGRILAIVGLVPLAAGLVHWCVFAPLFGLSPAGPRLRQVLQGAGQ